MVSNVLFNKKLWLLFLNKCLQKTPMIQLKENDSKTFSQPNFYSFNGKKCLRFLRNCFYQKLLAILNHS